MLYNYAHKISSCTLWILISTEYNFGERICKQVQLPSPVPNPAAAPPGTAPARPASAHGKFPNCTIKDDQY